MAPLRTAPAGTLLGRLPTIPFAVLKRFRPHRPIHLAGAGLEGTPIRTGGGTSGARRIDGPARARTHAPA